MKISGNVVSATPIDFKGLEKKENKGKWTVKTPVEPATKVTLNIDGGIGFSLDVVLNKVNASDAEITKLLSSKKVSIYILSK